MNVQRKHILVFDLDNCLVSDSERMHLIKNGGKHGEIKAHESLTGDAAEKAQCDWDAYHCAGFSSRVCNDALLKARFAQMPPTSVLVFLTARPEKFRLPTIKHLRMAGLLDRNHSLVMRPHRCLASSPVMKVSALKAWLDDRGWTFDNIAELYDDRDDVLEAFRAHGVTATKLAIEER